MSACWQTRSAYEFAREAWVDSVFNNLSKTEKIGQLFSVRAHSNLGPEHVAEVEKLVRDYKVGGLTFFQGGPYRQAILTNRYQSLARIPLLVAIDGEWGLGMRLDSTMSFPRQMTLGAIQEDSLVKEMGGAIARQCRRLGIHVNFAPVIDINNNPNNPVINDRSFGEDKENVARKGIAYMEGLQSEGVLANAKHFPGHGDTDQDSHYTLPVILHPRGRIDQMELYPFARLFAKGLQSLMVAHLQIPALDQSPNRPTTLSRPVVTDLLQKEMGFEGLIFTDALGMQGVTKFYAPGEISVMALEAGNDVLLVPDDVPQAVAKIEAALQTGRLTWEMIDLRVKKILRAKYFAGLHQYKPIDLAGLARDLHLPQDEALQARLFEKALTVVQNEEALLPLRKLGQAKMASVALGTSQLNAFQKRLSDYAAFEHFQLAEKNLPYPFNQLLEKLEAYEVVVVSLHNLHKKSRENFGLTWQEREFIQKLGQKTRVVLAIFGSPYSLRFFESLPALVCAYEDNPITQGLVPQLLFGAIAAEGKLPVSASVRFGLGQGLRLAATGRLRFGLPESVGMRRDTLAKIDELVAQMIESGATPGVQIVIARQGQVVWNKGYGHHTYARERPVSPETVYDVASITKVAATLPALMYLYEQGKIKLNEKVATYLPELLKTDKANITLRDVLTHQAGLVPYLPHWEKTVNKATGAFVPGHYQKTKSEEYARAVAKDLYGHQSLEDSLWRWTIASPSRKPKRRPPFFPMNTAI
ncbi:MAG: serine hydrolase [Microscillaceae bacterium]|nr:serine hydrolase [Microscillaceae bacterium]